MAENGRADTDPDLSMIIIAKLASLNTAIEKTYDELVLVKNAMARLETNNRLAADQVRPLGVEISNIGERVESLEEWRRESSLPPGTGV